MSTSPYDEFGLLAATRDEWGLTGPIPPVRRGFVAVDGLREVSALAWGDGPATMALLHGLGQNAHTFDAVALALGRPSVALDLPHHGWSDASPYGAGSVWSHADDLSVALSSLLVGPVPLVGMSLGGLVAIALAHRHASLVSRVVLLDITPGVDEDHTRSIHEFINGPATFASLEEMVERAVAHNPERSRPSLERGVRHNAIQRFDGRWVWRHQQHPPAMLRAPEGDLWDALAHVSQPLVLVRGRRKGSVVTDADVRRLRQLQPTAEVIEVDAGHSIQSDAPLALATLLAGYS